MLVASRTPTDVGALIEKPLVGLHVAAIFAVAVAEEWHADANLQAADRSGRLLDFHVTRSPIFLLFDSA